MSEPFVAVKDLRKDFNGQKAVDGVSFTIDKGECFGLLGPNGAGKTTTIRMLATVLAPDGGDAAIGGFSIKNQLYRLIPSLRGNILNGEAASLPQFVHYINCKAGRFTSLVQKICRR